MLDTIPKISVGKFIVTPGSKLICFTDGIVELENDKLEQFGTDQIEAQMRKGEEMNIDIDKIIDVLYEHKGHNDFFDDITMLGIQFH